MPFKIFGIVIFMLQCYIIGSTFIIVPEDVPTALVGIYGFAPKIVKGNDGKYGFGFRFGNHADLQVVYEFGPRALAVEPIKTRSAVVTAQRQRRRPLLELLLRTGLVKQVSYNFNFINDDDDDGYIYDEPR